MSWRTWCSLATVVSAPVSLASTSNGPWVTSVDAYTRSRSVDAMQYIAQCHLQLGNLYVWIPNIGVSLREFEQWFVRISCV